MVHVSEFDPSAFLDDDEVVVKYLTAALEDDNQRSFSLRLAMSPRRAA